MKHDYNIDVNIMKISNGLLVKRATSKFNKINKVFIAYKKEYPNYSLFLDFLFLRFCDAYDLSLFYKHLEDNDKTNNSYDYQRFKNAKKIIINKLYGPFISGSDNYKLYEKIEDVLDKIIKNKSYENDKILEIYKEADIDNVYDLYNSYYYPKKVNKNIKIYEEEKRAETDSEYILWNYTNLRHEQDNRETIDLKTFPKELYENKINEYKHSEIEDENEPNDLESIIKSSPNFSSKKYKISNYDKRLEGALIGRFIGCMLGAPVENYSIERMEEIAKMSKMDFPPTHYWNIVENENVLHYKKDKKRLFSHENMCRVLADDDITYTVLNALIINKYGKNFTSYDIASFWKNHLPYACTAEYETMVGLRKGYDYHDIVNDNPFVELIGADIRADIWGYVNPGRPDKAAMMAYKDACISHKRNGIYGAMYLAAAISLAFVVPNIIDVFYEGLNYIPKNCRLAKEIKWALSYENKIKDYKEARRLVEEHFPYMNKVHTINNMCCLIFAFSLGKEDFDSTIANCVAIGYDNDCTAASCGSLIGAFLTIDKINKKWYQNYNDTISTYIRGYETFKISSLLRIIKNKKG